MPVMGYRAFSRRSLSTVVLLALLRICPSLEAHIIQPETTLRSAFIDGFASFRVFSSDRSTTRGVCRMTASTNDRGQDTPLRPGSRQYIQSHRQGRATLRTGGHEQPAQHHTQHHSEHHARTHAKYGEKETHLVSLSSLTAQQHSPPGSTVLVRGDSSASRSEEEEEYGIWRVEEAFGLQHLANMVHDKKESTLLGSHTLLQAFQILQEERPEEKPTEDDDQDKLLGSRRLGSIARLVTQRVDAELTAGIERAQADLRSMGLGGSSEEQDTAALGGAEGSHHSMSLPEAAAEAHEQGARGGSTKPELSGEGSGATAQQLPPPPPPPAGSEARGEEGDERSEDQEEEEEEEAAGNWLQQETIMAASVEDVFFVASDLAEYGRWAGDGIKRVEVTEEEGLHRVASYTAGALGYMFDFLLGWRLEPHKKISFSVKESSMISRLDGAYRFKPLPDGKTEVSFRLCAEIDFVPQFIQSSLANLVIAIALGELKKYMESPRSQEHVASRPQ